ncbi:protein PHYTOCHROME KINASE SUBSTRATE 4 [Lolium perenne]|uniref:protein PHYTOCHROME KINASE SUBSTRATE 4 n=1 Tax=Lolium perenne TaxID=4522 RepID=UPI0021F5C31A|nr:protein PHYTOCHROME KINASE SUBSTRATE 4 [Lolium perenne]
MDRYRVAPSRPVFLSGATHRLQPAAGRRSAGPDTELDIFTAERYFNAADAIKYSAAAVHAADAPTSQTAASSEASWNSRSGLLASNRSSSTAAAARQHDKVGHGGGNAIDLGLGLVVEVARDDRYHRGGIGKKTGQRWGLFSRDCPCAGRKAVTVDVASEPPSPTTPRIHHPRIDALEERAVFKANGLPPPSPNDEPGVMKIVSTAGSRAFPLRASIDGVIPPAPNQGSASSFPAFPPDVGRRVVSSGSGFTFPVIAPAVVDDPPRESLEVFRPIDEDSVVLVDPPPPSLGVAGFLRAPAAVAAATDHDDVDDAMSDASSDLFDLESFAASSSYPTTYRGRSSRRNSGDEDHLGLGYAAAAAEPALSECMYAPSEASVVWSVATAEGVAYDAGSVANFSSAASACCVDDFRFVPPTESAAGHNGFTAAMSRSAGRKKGGGFLNSCRCEKAVSVGPTPVRVARPPAVPAKTAGRAMGLESGGAARYHNRRVHMPVRT